MLVSLDMPSIATASLAVLELGMHAAGFRPQGAGPDGEPRSSDSWCIIVFLIGAAMLLGHWGVAGGALLRNADPGI